MLRFNRTMRSALVVGSLSLLAPATIAQECPCDCDTDNSGGCSGTDVINVIDCINGAAGCEDCSCCAPAVASGQLDKCDIDCDGDHDECDIDIAGCQQDTPDPTCCPTGGCSDPQIPCGACCGVDGCTQIGQRCCVTGGGVWVGEGTTCTGSGGCPIPAVSEWGLAVLTLLVLTAGTVLSIRRQART